jgi:predicted DNA-binding transcriptional regulator AlpA
MQQSQWREPGFLRLSQIIGDPERGILPMIPVSAATWWRGCKSGRYPAPVKLSPGVTVWKRADVLALIEGVK